MKSLFIFLFISSFTWAQKFSPATYEVLGVTSSISGFTFITEWEQNDDFDTTYQGNIAEITFTGTLSLNCFVDGVGIFFSDHVTIKMKVNTETGQAISGHLYDLE